MAKIWKGWIVISAIASIALTLWFAKKDWKKVKRANLEG